MVWMMLEERKKLSEEKSELQQANDALQLQLQAKDLDIEALEVHTHATTTHNNNTQQQRQQKQQQQQQQQQQRARGAAAAGPTAAGVADAQCDVGRPRRSRRPSAGTKCARSTRPSWRSTQAKPRRSRRWLALRRWLARRATTPLSDVTAVLTRCRATFRRWLALRPRPLPPEKRRGKLPSRRRD